MALTRDFKATVQDRARRDPKFRAGLFEEAIAALLESDVATGKILLRDFINATIGFGELSRATGLSDKSLMRMFGPSGNPTVEHLTSVIKHLKDGARLKVSVHATPQRTPSRASQAHAAA